MGVLSGLGWSGQQTDPIYAFFNVSNANKVIIDGLTKGQMGKTNVNMQFDYYEFDPAENQKVFYKAFHTDDKELTGIIHKHGNDLALQGENTQSVRYPTGTIYKKYPDGIDHFSGVTHPHQSGKSRVAHYQQSR
jgi:hypothetical protein